MILDHLTPERITLSGRATDKRGVLDELARLLAAGASDCTAQAVLAGFLEREEMMSTGIGCGVAVPHARLDSIRDVRLALVRYPQGIDFRALDHQPIYLAFGIVGPPPGTGQHVKLLARIARLARVPEAVRELTAAATLDLLVDALRRRDVGPG